MKNTFVLGLVVYFMATQCGHAFTVSAPPIPVERLVSNAERNLKKNPGSADAHYTLSRIHYLAFSSGRTMLRGWLGKDQSLSLDEPRDWRVASLEIARAQRAEELAMIEVDRSGVARSPEWRTVLRESELRYERMLEKQNWTPATSLPAKVMIKHAALAFSELEAALKIDSEDALYHLGLASLTEQIVDWVAGEKKARVPAALRTLTYGRARDSYLRAFRAAYIKDRELKNLPDGGVWKFLSYEAGRGFLRLFDRDHERLNGDKDAVRAREEIDAALKKFESLRVDENSFILVSPIVVSLQAIRRLDELLAQEVTVDFDLMGHGPKHRWPWIRPTAGLLVWDPEKSGEITSARQLFGSYTFQIFRATGYEALAALDDDGDGFLRGAELRGVRVWFDTNSDGRSEPSEVHDLAALGIEAVAVRATGYDGIHPTCSAGILLSNGETLPTWDWMVSPIKE